MSTIGEINAELLCYNRAMREADNVAIELGGKITLPREVLSRYGLEKSTRVRVIPTRTGILLVPLTEEPMSEALLNELEAWQFAGNQTIEMFPYDEGPQS